MREDSTDRILLQSHTTALPAVGDIVRIQFERWVVVPMGRTWETTELSGPNPARIGDEVEIRVRKVAP